MAEKEKNPKEESEEGKRDVAMKNLKADNLVNLASSYFVHSSKDYGEADNTAMENFKFFPAFNSSTKAYAADGTEYDVVKNSILKSREDGRRYSGNVSEIRIMKDCAAILQESLNAVTVNDVMGLMGSNIALDEKYNGKYLGSLIPKVTDEEYARLPDDKKKTVDDSIKFYKTLVGGYQAYLTQTKVSEALAESAKEIPKGLEAILKAPEKEK